MAIVSLTKERTVELRENTCRCMPCLVDTYYEFKTLGFLGPLYHSMHQFAVSKLLPCILGCYARKFCASVQSAGKSSFCLPFYILAGVYLI